MLGKIFQPSVSFVSFCGGFGCGYAALELLRFSTANRAFLPDLNRYDLRRLVPTRLTERPAVTGVERSPIAARAPGDAIKALAGTPAPT